MSAPRTLDQLAQRAYAAIGNGYKPVNAIRAACEEHAAAETARLRADNERLRMELACAKPLFSRRQLEERHERLRAAGEALGEANRECVAEIARLIEGYNVEVYPAVKSSRAAIAAWREASK